MRQRMSRKSHEDHPRRCGENYTFAKRYAESTGSPPQVRGKPAFVRASSRTHRITPAGAGKTAFFANLSRLRPGSPPQVRGKPDEVTAYQAEARITPAGAGKTLRSLASVRSSQDHPRRCGENIIMNYWAYFWIGSPPQVRGKLFISVIKVFCSGITPAGAGKTEEFVVLQFYSRDHPRRCGENYLFRNMLRPH